MEVEDTATFEACRHESLVDATKERWIRLKGIVFRKLRVGLLWLDADVAEERLHDGVALFPR